MNYLNFKPTIILVRPQMAENIGATARAMSNFGFNDLTIVSPSAIFPSHNARAMAASGAYILDSAKVVATLDEAIADMQYLCATAAFGRMQKPNLAPMQAMSEVKALSQKRVRVGILFGCERSGLTNEELNFADLIISIPTAANSSLNLAQAVCVICYEYFRENNIEQPHCNEIASKGELMQLIKKLEEQLVLKHFFKNPTMRPEIMQNLINTFTKAQLSSQEIRTLHGVFRALNGNIW